MLIHLTNLKGVYQYILQNALEFDGKGCTIYIFVSNDTDSIASLKILAVSDPYLMNVVDSNQG